VKLIAAMTGATGAPLWPEQTGELTGRRAECDLLEQLVRDVRAGESRVLVVHGAPGVGKSALLEYLAWHAPGCQVVRTTGAQSEMELPFAGLQMLCAPMLGRLDALPSPQRDALRIAFGLSTGPTPDRFLVGLAVLGLCSEAAGGQPLICLVEDQQWLDRASAQVLAFVAQRLGAEPVGLVFAARQLSSDLAGLPELAVQGLDEDAARALLDSTLAGPMDDRVRTQIIIETRGNPMALLELPRRLTAVELAGGFGLPGAVPLAERIKESFGRRVSSLPLRTRELLLVAAADPTGDPGLVWRAAGERGIGVDAAGPAVDADLAEFDSRVRFRHPLARSAVYWSASAGDRRAAHRALAEVTDPSVDPDRRAWHRAHAATGPDEEVAAELECSAERARARGGLAAAAAFLRRSATMTLDPARRAGRALAAAQAEIQAGAFGEARALLHTAEAQPLSDVQRASIDMMRARLAYVTNRASDAAPLLVKAARRLAPIDAGLSRMTYLEAVSAAIFTGSLASPEGRVRAVARAASAAPPARHPRSPCLLLDGLVAQHNHGDGAGVPILRRALSVFGVDMSVEEELRWLWLACVAAMRVWDDERWDTLTARHVQLTRQTGALSELPLALLSRASMLLFAGDLAGAAALAAEARTAEQATGINLAPYGELGLAALRGDEARTAVVTAETLEHANKHGQGIGITFAAWANATLNNGRGRPQAVLAAARATAVDPDASFWPEVELIEAAVRSRETETATHSYRRLAGLASASGTDWAVGTHARSRALLTEGAAAEPLYLEAIDRLEQTRIRTDLARAHLLYGEWLRRARRRMDAREQLRRAHVMFAAMGAEAFARRAERELLATGETARQRTVETSRDLTAQEAQIVQLVRDGLSNPEIATRLFLSRRTIEWHLGNIFAKLNISSRRELRGGRSRG
jgi:DNA-binding CsgD family transcriptional regulator